MSRNSREYIRLYMRRYRFERRCCGHDHVPQVELPRDLIEPPTADEIEGAKQSLLSAHRLRAIGVATKKAP